MRQAHDCHRLDCSKLQPCSRSKARCNHCICGWWNCVASGRFCAISLNNEHHRLKATWRSWRSSKKCAWRSQARNAENKLQYANYAVICSDLRWSAVICSDMQCDVWMSRIVMVTVMWKRNDNIARLNGVKFNRAVASKNSRNHRCLSREIEEPAWDATYHHLPIFVQCYSSIDHAPGGKRIFMATMLCKHANAKNVFICILCMPARLDTVILCHAEQPNHFQYHNSMMLAQLEQHAETWCNMVPGLSLRPQSLFGCHPNSEGANLFENLFEMPTCIGSAQESV